MIRFKHRGDFRHTERFFSSALKADYFRELERYGHAGVDALALNTPMDTGKTASSWGFEIVRTKTGVSIIWTNSNVNNGVNIAVILQYGHGTGTGGYVEGLDYINPAIRPIFEGIADEAWREVKGL